MQHGDLPNEEQDSSEGNEKQYAGRLSTGKRGVGHEVVRVQKCENGALRSEKEATTCHAVS